MGKLDSAILELKQLGDDAKLGKSISGLPQTTEQQSHQKSFRALLGDAESAAAEFLWQRLDVLKSLKRQISEHESYLHHYKTLLKMQDLKQQS